MYIIINPRNPGGGSVYGPQTGFLAITTKRKRIKKTVKIFPQGSNSGCSDVYRVNVALSSTWSDLETKGTLRGKI